MRFTLRFPDVLPAKHAASATCATGEASRTWGSSGHVDFLDFLIRVCRMEDPGVPGLEPGPERTVKHAGSGVWSVRCVPALDHRICCRFQRCLPTTVW